MSTKPNSPHERGQDTVFDPLIETAAGTGRALVPGTMLEEYEIQRVLSESGFAVVYLAMDHAFDRLVVIKEYQPSTLAEHSEKSRAELRGQMHATAFKRGKYAFMSESRMLASCDHPSLLRVNRIWDANGTVYRVMPYYYGKSLQVTRQAASQAPDEASLLSLLDGLLGALSALHEQDCVHGAVSPDNILLLADDRPVLMDFGAVRRAIVSAETQRLIAMLEPSYLPMEQIEPTPPHAVPGPWSDLYSVAAVLYFCICGELPKRTRREPIATAVRKLQQRQPGLHYSAALLHTIDTALSENHLDRPQTVSEFRRLLDTPRAAPAAPAEAASAPVQAQQGASFPASDDMVNVQGRVVPFARRREPGPRPSALRQQPSRGPAPGWGAGGGAFPASAAMAADAGPPSEPEEPTPSRFYPSLQEMMAESEERIVADMRRERASRNFPGSAPIRPQPNRWLPRMIVALGVLVVLSGLGFGGWKLHQQRLADELLAEQGVGANPATPGMPASVPESDFPKPLAQETRPAPPLVETGRRPDAEPLGNRAGNTGNGRQQGQASRTAAATPTPDPTTAAPLAEERAPLPESVKPTAPSSGVAEIRIGAPAAGRSTMATASTSTSPDIVSTIPQPKPVVREPQSPREACGERTEFALYNCMQTQCARGRWSATNQCRLLRDTGEVIGG